MDNEHKETLGIMYGIKFGMVDGMPQPVLRFAVSTLEGDALQILSTPEYQPLFKENNICDLTQLEGHPCVVILKGYEEIRFLRLHKVN